MDKQHIIHRSASMPTQPQHIEAKTLQRSEEKELIYDIAEQDQEFDDESNDILRLPYPVDSVDFDMSDSLAMLRPTQSESNIIGAPHKSNNKWQRLGNPNDACKVNRRRNEIDDTRNTTSKRPSRIIDKNGRENVSFRRIPEKSWRFIRDFVTTLIELKWKYMLSMFVGSYCFTWFFFAVLCYMVSYYHGDLNFDPQTGERLGDGQQPCVVGVYNFISMLIYSIETQTTIGFGEKYPSEECPETIFLFILQIIVSIAIEGGMVSIIYAKTARPVKQITKLKFSDKAVICYRDGVMCLLFRVCDLRQQQTIDSKIRLYMITDVKTSEGEIVKANIELKLQNNGEQIIIWPEIVCHVIDASSPLARIRSARELSAAQFELYVSIVGVSATTAQITEARTSYVPREIYWGQRFINIVSYVGGRYVVDHSNFNSTISVDMLQVGS